MRTNTHKPATCVHARSSIFYNVVRTLRDVARVNVVHTQVYCALSRLCLCVCTSAHVRGESNTVIVCCERGAHARHTVHSTRQPAPESSPAKRQQPLIRTNTQTHAAYLSACARSGQRISTRALLHHTTRFTVIFFSCP